MLREVHMGDETREILRNSTTDHESSGSHLHLLTEDDGPDNTPSHHTSLPPPTSSAKHSLSPLGRACERHGAKAAIPKQRAAPRSLSTEIPGSPGAGVQDSPGRTRSGRVQARPLHLIHETEAKLARCVEEAASAEKTRAQNQLSTPAKRRNTGSASTLLPELDLEIDGSLETYLSEVPHDYDAKDTSTKQISTQAADLSAKLQTDMDAMSVTDLSGRFRELQTLLMSKEEDIRMLTAELNEKEEQHKAEIAKIRQELHREYSKQASEKLRIIVKRLELNAKKKAEKDWQDRVLELMNTVEKERQEKAELVKACDEYLQLKGF